MMAVSTN